MKEYIDFDDSKLNRLEEEKKGVLISLISFNISFKSIPEIGPWLSRKLGDVIVMIKLIRSFVEKYNTTIPFHYILIFLEILLYFATLIDVISNMILRKSSFKCSSYYNRNYNY